MGCPYCGRSAAGAVLRRPIRVGTSFLSSAKTFWLPLGRRFLGDGARGYYIDLSVKAQAPEWPPPWLGQRRSVEFVQIAQWGLGAFERYAAGEGEPWLRAAIQCGDYLLREQEPEGEAKGAWKYLHPFPHTYRLTPPWTSAMAQGEGASLLVRLGEATRDDRFHAGARAAVRAMLVPPEKGGACGKLGGKRFPQEYPTAPPSHVLNGAIFALWGLRDVGVCLGDSLAQEAFGEGLDCLAENIELWDTGYWSLYDVFPHKLRNVASSFYHSLHITQLEAMRALAERPELEAARVRFIRYRESRLDPIRAFAAKAAFRMVIPRNQTISRLLPWS